jgi:DNA (cytosine-5)-methyltransferase 1
VLDLFSGIGGFALGLESTGRFSTAGFVERDEYCRAVLRKHWPDVPQHDDIHTYQAGQFGQIDVITGGFPCQPFSHAGKQRGKEDDRYLWPEMLRVIAQERPTWVTGENVAGIIQMELDTVLFDLESIGYSSRAFVIPACAVDAPHRRNRVWIVAHTNEQGLEGLGGLRERAGERPPWSGRLPDETKWLPEPNVGRVANGVPSRVDRLRSLGNAVVPQVVAQIGWAISEAA